MDSDRVTAALTRAVRDHGRVAASQPERIRALLSDLLGSAARDLRAEVDAVVVASEEQVPLLLLAAEQHPDRAAEEAVARLEDRGLQTGLAVVAVAAWAAALGVPLVANRSLPLSAPNDAPSAGGGLLSSSEDSSGSHSTGSLTASSGARTELPRSTRDPDGAPAAGPEVVPAAVPGPSAGASTDGASTDGASTAAPVRGRASTRTRTVVGAGAAVAVLVAGVIGAQALWPSSAGGPTTDSAGGTLHLLSRVPVTWDPLSTTDAGLRLLMNRALYRGLLAFEPSLEDQPAALVPDLATSGGTTSDLGRTWTWTLVTNARWEDGQAVTCADARAGVQRAFAGAKYRGFAFRATRLIDVPLDRAGLPVFTGAAQSPGSAAFDKAVTCSGQDLTIRLARANLDFPRYLAVPELAPYRAAPGGGTRSLASGPYRVEGTGSTGTSAVLVRNSHWTRAADRLRPANPDRIQLTGELTATEITTRLQADAGADRQAAALQGLPASAEAGFRESPDRTQVAPNGNLEVLAANFASPTMQDKGVRQAVAWALDRDVYVRSMGGPATRTPLHSLAGTHRNGADKLVDAAKARAVLAGRHPVLRVLYHGGGEADVAMAGLASGWEAVGFTVQLKPFTGTATEYSRHLSAVSGTNSYDLARANPTVYLDPADNVTEYDARVTTRWLAKGYRSTTVTTAIDRARTTADPTDRAAAWNLVHSLVTADAVMIPLAARVAFVGYGSEVQGARTSNEFSGVLDTATISLTPEDRK